MEDNTFISTLPTVYVVEIFCAPKTPKGSVKSKRPVDHNCLKGPFTIFASLFLTQHNRKRVRYARRTRQRPYKSETVLQVAWRTSPAKTTRSSPISRSAASTVSLGKSWRVHKESWLKEHTCKVHNFFYLFIFFCRYLESCNIPVTVKRKYHFSSNTTSSNSDDDKKAADDCVQVPQENPGTHVEHFCLGLVIHSQCLLISLLFCLQLHCVQNSN